MRKHSDAETFCARLNILALSSRTAKLRGEGGCGQRDTFDRRAQLFVSELDRLDHPGLRPALLEVLQLSIDV